MARKDNVNTVPPGPLGHSLLQSLTLLYYSVFNPGPWGLVFSTPSRIEGSEGKGENAPKAGLSISFTVGGSAKCSRR